MTLPVFFPIKEEVIDNNNTNLPLLRPSTNNQNSLGGTVFNNYAVATGGTTVASGHNDGYSNKIYNTTVPIIAPHMTLLFDKHDGAMTTVYTDAILFTTDAFNFGGIAITPNNQITQIGSWPIIVQTRGDGYVYWDATGIIPIPIGKLNRTSGNVVTVTTTLFNILTVIGTSFTIVPGEANFPTGTKTVATIIDGYNFTYTEAGVNTTNIANQTIKTLVSRVVPSSSDFLGPTAVHGTVTPVFDGYSPIFGYALSAPFVDPNTGTTFQTILPDGAINPSYVGLIKMRIQPFYGFIPPLSPTITTFSPTSGIVGSTVLLTGAGFIGTTAVSFFGRGGSLPIVNATFAIISNNQILVTVPSLASTGSITISMPLAPGGTVATSNFTVVPFISNVTASTHNVGAVVNITGTTFRPATASSSYTVPGPGVLPSTLTFNGTDQPTFTIVNDTSITTTIPTGATTGPIVFTTIDGVASFAGTVLPVPTINALGITPLSGPKGTLISILGTGFLNNLAGSPYADGYGSIDLIKISGPGVSQFNIARTVFTDIQISATIPDAGSISATTYNVRITNSGGIATSAQAFTYISKPAFLTASSFSPTSGNAGVIITINGQWGFTGISSVFFGAYQSPTVTFINDTQITAIVPTTPSITPTQPIIITAIGGKTSSEDSDAAGTGQVTNPSDFTILFQPIINTFAPHSGKSGDIITVNGVNLTSINRVFFTSFNATAIAGNMTRSSSTVSVTTDLPHGFSTSDNILIYPISTADPNYPSIIVAIIKTGASTFTYTQVGTTVASINGYAFNDTIAICTVGGGTLTLINSTQLTAVVPASATGIKSGSITISVGATPPLFYMSATNFSYLQPPIISSLDKSSGGFGSPPTRVTIIGTGLLNSNGSSPTITFTNGITANVASASSTSVIFTVPVGATTGFTLTTDGGFSAAGGASTFHVVQKPTITLVNPTSACFNINTTIAITGTILNDVGNAIPYVYFNSQTNSRTHTSTLMTQLTNNGTTITINSSQLALFDYSQGDITFTVQFILAYDIGNGQYTVNAPQTFTNRLCIS